MRGRVTQLRWSACGVLLGVVGFWLALILSLARCTGAPAAPQCARRTSAWVKDTTGGRRDSLPDTVGLRLTFCWSPG